MFKGIIIGFIIAALIVLILGVYCTIKIDKITQEELEKHNKEKEKRKRK